MIDLGDRFTKEWAGRPPGMSRFDREIWESWKIDNILNLASIYYNVGIGPNADCGHKESEKVKKLWWRLCCRRIDILVKEGDQILLIEARNEAKEDAIARLLIYKKLWEREYQGKIKAKPILITNTRIEETAELAWDHEINYYVA